MKRILIGTVAGAVLSAVALSGGTALAGSGVGAVFNLGQTNAVDAQTVLTGTVNGALLRVTNTGTGATAMNLQVPTGHAPFITNGTGKVTNLQADTVDGQSANEIARVVGQHGSRVNWIETGWIVLQTVTITAPQQGFVFLSGNAVPSYFTGCAFCAVHLRFHDVEADNDTVATAAVLNQTGVEWVEPLAISFTLPVTAGTHTYQLLGSWYDPDRRVAPDAWYDRSANALFFRYNGAGTSAPFNPGPSAPAPNVPGGSLTAN
jgi:hypothetical protein